MNLLERSANARLMNKSFFKTSRVEEFKCITNCASESTGMPEPILIPWSGKDMPTNVSLLYC